MNANKPASRRFFKSDLARVDAHEVKPAHSRMRNQHIAYFFNA